jgi:hypothetical protein
MGWAPAAWNLRRPSACIARCYKTDALDVSLLAHSYIKQCLGSPTPAEHEAVVAERDGLQKQLEEANQLIAELQARIQQLETQAETA